MKNVLEYNRKTIGTIDIKEKDSKHKYNSIAYENISDTFYLVNFCLFTSLLVLLFENFILHVKLYLIKSLLNEILIQLIP